jgi:hypothetical protein
MARPKAEAKGGARVNKRRAVRAALEVLGMDASPGDIQAHLKKGGGPDLSTNMISSYKSQIRREAGLEGKRRGRGAGAAATPRAAGDGISLEDLRTLKAMAARLGARRLKDLFEILCS